MKLIVTGATGTAGSEVVRQAIADPAITAVTAIVRKPLDIKHEKLTTIIHQNFLDYSSLNDVFIKHDACTWCLGISQTLVSKEEYHVITYDYTIAGAAAMLNANPRITFLFLSGMGADPSEKSRTLFARVKGKTENALLKLPFEKLYIVRPSGIKPEHIKKSAPWFEKLLFQLYPFFKIVTPFLVITTVQLAKAMLNILKNGSEKTIIENNELKKLGN
jgi:uncharacterized protein YbjT (DUF2867 family)